MALNSQVLSDAPIIELDTIDSTNNYAMRLIDADTAQAGLTIVTRTQYQGKGQRGKMWADEPNMSLLMSMIVVPAGAPDTQFAYNAMVAASIADTLFQQYDGWDVQIKWPNDIIINDKKAGGILIENIIRGSKWAYSIIGLGLNVHQEHFDNGLPFATSLKIASGNNYDLTKLLHSVRQNVLPKASSYIDRAAAMRAYNEYLYRRGEWQVLEGIDGEFKALILHVSDDGRLYVQTEEGTKRAFAHGEVIWVWR